MQTGGYTVSAGVTRNKIIFLLCSCDSGGIDNEKVVCVHILPVLYQLTELLCNNFSEIFLVELANWWPPTLEELATNKKASKEDLQALMYADGCTCKKLTGLMSLPTICQVLESSTVGTEKQKMAPRFAPYTKHVPLRKLKRKSVATLCSEQVKLRTAVVMPSLTNHNAKQTKKNGRRN